MLRSRWSRRADSGALPDRGCCRCAIIAAGAQKENPRRRVSRLLKKHNCLEFGKGLVKILRGRIGKFKVLANVGQRLFLGVA